jgi:hypothetical protein
METKVFSQYIVANIRIAVWNGDEHKLEIEHQRISPS